MKQKIQTTVSRKKRRYIKGDYNLDLSYISLFPHELLEDDEDAVDGFMTKDEINLSTSNDRIIAMGYPSETVYRNSIVDVARFLNNQHGTHYRIYNLCAEPDMCVYSSSKFEGKIIECFQFFDHQPPPFNMIENFCQDADNWLSVNDNHVIAVHCKAGKGRTGTMICCHLLYYWVKHRMIVMDHVTELRCLDAVLDQYGKMRTTNNKGVTITSQQRYIEFFAQSLFYKPESNELSWNQLSEYRYKLMKIETHNEFTVEGTSVIIEGTQWSLEKPRITFEAVFSSRECGSEWTTSTWDMDVPCKIMNIESGCVINGDFKVLFYRQNDSKRALFQFWFNTTFLHFKGPHRTYSIIHNADEYKLLLHNGNLECRKKHLKSIPYQIVFTFKRVLQRSSSLRERRPQMPSTARPQLRTHCNKPIREHRYTHFLHASEARGSFDSTDANFSGSNDSLHLN